MALGQEDFTALVKAITSQGKKADTNAVQNGNFCNWKNSPGFVILQWWGNTWDFNLWRTAFPYKSQSVI